MEMPGIVNVISRFRTRVVPMPVENGLIPRLRRPTNAAPMSPNTAPEAPPCDGRLQQERARRAAEQGRHVERREAHPADRRLQQLSELEQQQHVEGDVEDPEVDEADVTRRYHSPSSASTERIVPSRVSYSSMRPRSAWPWGQLAAAGPGGRVLESQPQEHGQVDRHEAVGHEGRLTGAPIAGSGRHVRALGLGAVDAVAADRGLDEALGAGPLAAARAAPAGLPVRMPVTRRRLRHRRLGQGHGGTRG